MIHFFPHPVLIIVAIASCIVLIIWRLRARQTSGWIIRFVTALLLLIIAIRPTFGDAQTVTYSPGIDVVIMIDRTTSMAAEDYAGRQRRLSGATDDLAQIVASVEGARLAVVVFDNNARIALPFTTDATAAVSLIDAIGWREVVYGNGTDISVGIPLAEDLLKSSKAQRPEVGRYLVYIGDGEQTIDQAPASFEPLRQYLDGGLVLGYGTADGGPMKTRPGSSDYVTVNGEIAYSRMNEANLVTIAEQLQVGYQHRTEPGKIMLPTKKSILVPTVHTDPRGIEIYWVIAIGIIALLATQLWHGIIEIRHTRRQRL